MSLKLMTAALLVGGLGWFADAAPAAPAAAPAAPAVEAVKVLAGDYVDTSSMESIVDGLFKSKTGWTDEQKLINFYHWYRRLVYPYRYMASDRRDVLKALNTAGFSLCGSQAAVTTAIVRAAGYPARPVQVAAGKEWGHTVWEVKYGEGWHLFDAMTAFYVLTRDNPPHVAGVEEIEADPTLVTQAVAEKRCGPEFVYTARDHEISLEQRQQFQDQTRGQDVPWSLLTTKGGSMMDFWTTAATKKKISPGKEGDAYGSKYTPGVLDVRLKANERYVRLWTGQGKWLTNASFVKFCPQNMAAGDSEKYDTVNFKYFEPYRQAEPNPFNKAIYRSYGNGWLEWTPATAAQLAQGVEKIDNLKEMPPDRNRGFATFTVEDGARPATLVLPVKSPYGVVEIEADLALSLPKDAIASLTLTPTADGKAAGSARKVWASNATPSTAPDAARAETANRLTKIVIPLMDYAGAPIYEYALKVELTKSAGATVGLKRLKTTFQLNPMSLPGLVPGANKIRVSAAKPTTLAGGKLVVKYDWFDAPEWTKPNSNTKELTDLPVDYEIALPAGEKLPRMKSLELFLKAD